jgi:Fe-S cluster biosynthesis and repair protein YggX
MENAGRIELAEKAFRKITEALEAYKKSNEILRNFERVGVMDERDRKYYEKTIHNAEQDIILMAANLLNFVRGTVKDERGNK